MVYLDAGDVEDCLSDGEILEIVEKTLRGVGFGAAQNGPKGGFGEGSHVHLAACRASSIPAQQASSGMR